MKTFDLFFPRSIFATKILPVLGTPIIDVPQCVWNASRYVYEFEVTYSWTISDISIANQAFGLAVCPRVFGAKDKEINFDVNSSKPVVGGWLLPNVHTFKILYSWLTQNLELTVSWYKFEARVKDNELSLTKLL